jgi:hypothetical protein
MKTKKKMTGVKWKADERVSCDSMGAALFLRLFTKV